MHGTFIPYLQRRNKTIWLVQFIFNSIRELVLKVCFIELAKLINKSKNDHFNIFDFFDGLENGAYGELKISTDVISKWRKIISGHSKTIKTIVRIRNKTHAHTDRNFDIKKEKITFQGIREMVESIEIIVKDVYEIELNSSVLFEAPFFNSSKFDMVEILSKYKAK